MSTRCQVQVIQESEHWEDKITLYHHWDGYPENIIPLIYKAYCYGNSPFADNENYYKTDLMKERAGKAASLLCWADPAQFEPEQHHKLHLDIDYYYRLYCSESPLKKRAIWEVEIFGTDWSSEFEDDWDGEQKYIFCNEKRRDFFRHPKLEKLALIEKRQSIEKLLIKYPEDEMDDK
jgi:hypothetical protein